jgi:hypothetical protein
LLRRIEGGGAIEDFFKLLLRELGVVLGAFLADGKSPNKDMTESFARQRGYVHLRIVPATLPNTCATVETANGQSTGQVPAQN